MRRIRINLDQGNAADDLGRSGKGNEEGDVSVDHVRFAACSFGDPPSPDGVRSWGELSARLRALQAWAGVPYRELHRRVVRLRRARGVAERPSYSTVYRCLQPGRSRLDVELVVDIATALLGDARTALPWRQTCQVVAGTLTEAARVTVAEVLPHDTAPFTGRKRELRRLLGAAYRGPAETGPLVAAIEGMAGVGKTKLAVHAAHRLVRNGRFAQVQLTVDLRGYDADWPPADPAAVLDAFLRQLGFPGAKLPGMPLEHRAAKFRELLATRQTLLLLDNAVSEDQIWPLLPGCPHSLVLITSRRRLDRLPAVHVRLDPFTPAESLSLLRRTIGAERVQAEAAAAAQVAHQVGQLPLAVALVAARVKATPDWTLADHAERLVEHRATLRLGGEVEAAFGVSYDDLPTRQRRLFRLLALHPPHDFDVYAAAALAETDLATAKRDLGALAERHLVQPRTAHRYGLHDLVRVFARQRAQDEDSPAMRRAAVRRLVEYLRFAAATADALIDPKPEHRRAAMMRPDCPVPQLSDRTVAMAWLNAERANLLAAADYCAARGWVKLTSDFSEVLGCYLYVSGHYREAEKLHVVASEQSSGVDRGRALLDLAGFYSCLGRYTEAADHGRRSVELLRGADAWGEARALGILGLVHQHQSEYPEALTVFRQALSMFAAIGDRVGESRVSHHVGAVHMLLGHDREALQHLERSLTLAVELDDRSTQGMVLDSLGTLHARRGCESLAVGCLRQALAIARELGHRVGEAATLIHLGSVHGQLGRHERALDAFEKARAIAAESGDRRNATVVHNELGAYLARIGRTQQAIRHHREALAGSIDLGDRYQQARAHEGIARTSSGDGADLARHHWQRALELYHALGTPEATHVAARLSAPDSTAAGPRPPTSPAQVGDGSTPPSG